MPWPSLFSILCAAVRAVLEHAGLSGLTGDFLTHKVAPKVAGAILSAVGRNHSLHWLGKRARVKCEALVLGQKHGLTVSTRLFQCCKCNCHSHHQYQLTSLELLLICARVTRILECWFPVLPPLCDPLHFCKWLVTKDIILWPNMLIYTSSGRTGLWEAGLCVVADVQLQR